MGWRTGSGSRGRRSCGPTSVYDSNIRFVGGLAFENFRANYSTQEEREDRRYGGAVAGTNVYRKSGDDWVVLWQQETLTPRVKISREKVKGEHVYWGYAEGHFKKLDSQNWAEDYPGNHFEFIEAGHTDDYVELFDDGRRCTVRLYDNRCEVRGPFTNMEFKDFHDGEWGSE
ncbi:hypothetical protein ACYOEI_09110 [Singulisphaera rosea]